MNVLPFAGWGRSMWVRFRTSARLAPGLRLYAGLSGLALRVGGHGTGVTFSRRGTIASLTSVRGLWFFQRLSGRGVSTDGAALSIIFGLIVVVLLVLGWLGNLTY